MEYAPMETRSAPTMLTIEASDQLSVAKTSPSRGKGRKSSAAAGQNSEASLGPVRILPNPIRSMGEIEIDLPAAGTIQAELQDLGGRKLALLYSGNYNGTKQRIPLNVQNFPSGLYFCEVYVAGQRFHRLITISR